MSSAWIIDTDLICEGDDDGVMGPSSISEKDSAALKAGQGHKFRMRDADDEIYYEGRCLERGHFAPLDDFGLPNAGAVTIAYLENGQWRDS